MTTQPNDGGPAFPGTLRDWFAGQAITRNDVDCVQDAYAWADAMIKFRDEK